MMIDCDACAARGPACGDCVVTVLLGAPPADRPGAVDPGIDLDGREQAALAVLAGSGLIPPLRLVPAAPRPLLEERPAERPGPRPDERPDDRPGAGHRTAV